MRESNSCSYNKPNVYLFPEQIQQINIPYKIPGHDMARTTAKNRGAILIWSLYTEYVLVSPYNETDRDELNVILCRENVTESGIMEPDRKPSPVQFLNLPP